MSLRITDRRRELLQAVAAGAVQEHYPLGSAPSYSEWDRGLGWPHSSTSSAWSRGRSRCLTVTADVRRLADAGLVRLAPSSGYMSSRRWETTGNGRSVLDLQSSQQTVVSA
jgi:hypothetical protein